MEHNTLLLQPNGTHNQAYAEPKSSKIGTLTVVGVGPGDPELITVKGVRRLQAADVIIAPRAKGADTSQAEQVAAPWLNLEWQQVIPLEFPLNMSPDALDEMWSAAAELLAGHLLEGQELVYLIVGDPLLFGSFVYLWERLTQRYPQIPVKMIPGISSVNAGAAAAGVPLALGSERVALLPATYEDDPDTLRRMLADFETVVMLKAGRSFKRLFPFLQVEGLLPYTTVVERASLPNQRVFHDPWQALEAKLSYWTLVIVRQPTHQASKG
ncbi:MAG: precorrin-2 C(20)-methyltransferase [Ardenticatenaceae bacterium]